MSIVSVCLTISVTGTGRCRRRTRRAALRRPVDVAVHLEPADLREDAERPVELPQREPGLGQALLLDLRDAVAASSIQFEAIAYLASFASTAARTRCRRPASSPSPAAAGPAPRRAEVVDPVDVRVPEDRLPDAGPRRLAVVEVRDALSPPRGRPSDGSPPRKVALLGPGLVGDEPARDDRGEGERDEQDEGHEAEHAARREGEDERPRPPRPRCRPRASSRDELACASWYSGIERHRVVRRVDGHEPSNGEDEQDDGGDGGDDPALDPAGRAALEPEHEPDEEHRREPDQVPLDDPVGVPRGEDPDLDDEPRRSARPRRPGTRARAGRSRPGAAPGRASRRRPRPGRARRGSAGRRGGRRRTSARRRRCTRSSATTCVAAERAAARGRAARRARRRRARRARPPPARAAAAAAHERAIAASSPTAVRNTGRRTIAWSRVAAAARRPRRAVPGQQRRPRDRLGRRPRGQYEQRIEEHLRHHEAGVGESRARRPRARPRRAPSCRETSDRAHR